MENLTRINRIAFQAPDVNPVSAHRLVVFKRVGAGQVFRQVVAPGEKIKLRFLESSERLLAYAVPSDPNLRHRFSRPYEHVEQQHSYILHFEVAFSVEDPRSLVEQLESDPLQKLEVETARLFGGAIRHLPWLVIEHEDEHLEKEALYHGRADLSGLVRSNIDQLRAFASNLGIALIDVVISRTLPEKSIIGRLREVEIEQEKLARLAEHGLVWQERVHAAELADFDVSNRGRLVVRNSMADSVAKLVERGIGDIRSIQEVEESLPRLEGIIDRTRQLVGRSSEIGAAGTRTLPGLSSKAFAAAKGDCMLADLLIGTMALRGGDSAIARRRLGAAALHLLAEISLGEDASEDAITAHAGTIQEHFSELLPALTNDQVILLRRLQDLNALRALFVLEESFHD